MNTKKILIGAGVGAILAWGWFTYNKNKSEKILAPEHGGTKDSADMDFPDADPIADTVHDSTPVDEIQEISDEVVIEAKPIQQPTVKPIMQAEPNMEYVADDQPLINIVQDPTTKPYVQESTPIRQTTTFTAVNSTTDLSKLSRFSNFQGGADYVEVGSTLTDLN